MKRINLIKGFTLIELMVVVAIIGMLASLAAIGIPRVMSDSEITLTKSQIKNIAHALQMYKLKYQKYPSTSIGLKALVKKDRSGHSYIQKIPQDAWKNSFVYKRKRRKFTLTSYGADGQAGGEGVEADIIYSSSDGFKNELEQ